MEKIWYLRPMASKAHVTKTHHMGRASTDLLRVTLIFVGLGLLVGQFSVPVWATEVGDQFPEVAFLVTQYSVAGIVSLAMLQLALVLVWRLLAQVAKGTIFSVQSLKWVNAVIVFLALAFFIPAAVLSHLLLVVRLGGPAILIVLVAAVLSGVGLTLFMLVLRGLLVDATADRTELDQHYVAGLSKMRNRLAARSN